MGIRLLCPLYYFWLLQMTYEKTREQRLAEIRAKFNVNKQEKKVTIDTIMYDLAVMDDDKALQEKYLFAKVDTQ